MNKRGGPTVTVIDVAREAGVSPSTAARVLRKSSYPVKPQLKARVKEAADRIGYVPNMLARTLRGVETIHIGLIVGNMLDPFFGEIAEAVTDEARLQSGLAIVSNMERDPRLEIELCRRLWEHRVTGLILSGGGFDQETHKHELAKLIKRMTASGVAVVSLAERFLDVPVYTVDNAGVGEILARNILSNDHREIAVISGPPHSLTTQNRMQSVRTVLSKAGVEPIEINAEFSTEGGREAIGRLLDDGALPTAVICGGDTIAIGAIQCIRERGLSVPGDISVIGVGKTVYRSLYSPTLSTVDVSVGSCARAAVRHVARRRSDVGKIWPATLIEGESVARRP